MERAGLAAAHIARSLCADRGRAVLVIAGPGNNGGDALVVARHLKEWWFKVEVVFTGEPAKLPADARAAHDAWRDADGITLTQMPANPGCDLIVDGLFGIGLRRDLTAEHAATVAAINRLSCRVLALDVPSGLDSDTGAVRGCAVRAHTTATFIGLKAGLLTLEGPDYCGEIHLCTLGLAPPASPYKSRVIGADILNALLPVRRLNSHKGDYGSVGILGGAAGMAGAALLAGRAALQLGVGRVYLGLLHDTKLGYDPVQPELMLRPAHQILGLEHLNAFAIGPGLGQTPDAFKLVMDALQTGRPLVIDADALNLLAQDGSLQQAAASRSAPTLLTPHPAEAARLLGSDTAAVQSDRIGAAITISQRYKSFVVLKGAGSVCTNANGAWYINTSGNPGMASAGMGDVLTGIITALLAQGVDPLKALLGGVHLHGAAGDALAGAVGKIGMTASECITAARRLLNHL
ncbi:MAG: yjeF-like protein hydroxyethylthiazole kinaserelated protein [Betaproteobacteria bacterium]|nr:yjeF-like protein hydroxyethylthiazole kinaserelated protein [Betaproteobacteria bacterium]